jgi:carboxypeptidase A2
MAKVSLILLAALCAVAVEAYEKSYYGYELLEVFIQNERDQQALNYLSELDPELDFWYEGSDSNHVFVPPEKLDDVKEFFSRNSIDFRVKNDHVQQDIEQESFRLSKKKVFDVNDFNTYDDISAELVNLAGRCRSDLGVTCEVYSSGKSAQNRDIWTLKMSRAGSGRKAVWVDATIHAREWLATATHLKILTNLVDNYPTDADVQRLVDTYDWYFMPVANPDGYVYTWTSDRMWRKNRTPNSGSSCIGTDLNRNFNQMWGNAGSSASPCSETFRGAAAGSEPETQVLQNEALRLGSSLATSIHFHTYGQYWLIPWGSYAADGRTCNIAPDDAEMMVVANAVANAIQGTYNTNWLRGNSCATIYPASGITMDYFKGVAGVKYVATPELRGGSFVVSNTQIPLSYNEVWNGFLALFNTLPQ